MKLKHAIRIITPHKATPKYTKALTLQNCMVSNNLSNFDINAPNVSQT